MQDYKRIILATDFSKVSEVASAKAAKLAKRDGAELILLRVIEHFPQDQFNEWITPEGVAPKKYFEAQAKTGLQELARILDCETSRQEIILSADSASHEIIRFAKENKADLIVLGTHGHKEKDNLILGSTASGVVQGASCDVLIVKNT